MRVHQFLTPMVNYETSYLIWNQMTLMIKSEILRNTHPDVEPIDIEYLLEDNQTATLVNFLTEGTQEDKQRFIDLLNARIDRVWEDRKAASRTRRIPRRPDIYAYAQLIRLLPPGKINPVKV